MMETNVLIGAGVGLVFGFMLGWLIATTKKEKKAKAKATTKELPPGALAFLNSQEPCEIFDVHVARTDVERQALIGVLHHIDDLTEELKENAEFKNLLRLIILGYDVDGERLLEKPDLCAHFMKIHEERPYLAVFFDKPSMKLYLKFLLKGRQTAGMIPEHPVVPPLETLEQEIVSQTTQMLTTILGDRQELMTKVLDQLLSRLEGVCDAMEREEQARLNAALQPAAPAAAPAARR